MMKYDAMIKGQIQGVYNYLVETEHVWNKVYNLKLYDAFFKAEELVKEFPLLDADKWDDYFYDFCEYSYDQYEENVREGLLDPTVVKRIGRTSGFYLTDIRDIDMTYVIYNAIADSTGAVCPFTIYLNDGNLTYTYDYDLDEIEMKWYAENLLKEVREFLAPAVEYATRLNEFKDNQVKAFRCFLEQREEMEEQEEENR